MLMHGGASITSAMVYTTTQDGGKHAGYPNVDLELTLVLLGPYIYGF